jgi:hypothetical protein
VRTGVATICGDHRSIKRVRIPGLMRRSLLTFTTPVAVLLVVSCGGESKQASTATSSPVPKVRQTTTTPAPDAPKVIPVYRYPDAIDWFRSTKGFRFTLSEGNSTVTGEMARPAIAAERVHFRQDGVDWLGASRPSGLQWYRQVNGRWVREAQAPDGADRIFQRVTVAFDPQKKEPEALLVATESLGGEVCQHFRFTNANTLDVHDVWMRRRDGSFARISITGKSAPITLSIGSSIAPEDVPDPAR